MFLQSSTALSTFLVGWYVSAASYPQGDVILTQLACPLNDVFLCTLGIINLFLYKHCHYTVQNF